MQGDEGLQAAVGGVQAELGMQTDLGGYRMMHENKGVQADLGVWEAPGGCRELRGVQADLRIQRKLGRCKQRCGACIAINGKRAGKKPPRLQGLS